MMAYLGNYRYYSRLKLLSFNFSSSRLFTLEILLLNIEKNAFGSDEFLNLFL